MGVLHDGALHVALTIHSSNPDSDMLSCAEEDNIQPVDEDRDKLVQTVALPMLWNLVPDTCFASDALLTTDRESLSQPIVYPTTSTTSSDSSSASSKFEVYTKEPKTALLDEEKETSLIVHRSDEPAQPNNCLHASKQHLTDALGCCKRWFRF